MKIAAILRSSRPTVSFEIFPPKSQVGRSREEVIDSLNRTKEIARKIAAEQPAFISVTYGAAGGSTGENTAEISRYVQDETGVTVLAHLTCLTATRAAIDENIRSFREHGIENILCLRGDYPPDAERKTEDFSHAVDLVRALHSSEFCLGGACYPECHPECEHLEEDIRHLTEKVNAGLDFLTTQMFFDNNVYFHYLARLRSAGITIPVLPGIMPVTNGRQIARICKLSGTILPPRFRAIVDRFGEDPVSMMSAGIVYATEQIIDLFANGVTNVHVYTMNKPEVAIQIMRNLHGIVARGQQAT